MAAGSGEVTWREPVEGSYVVLTPGAGGLYRSRVFPGLWLDPAARLRATAGGSRTR